MRIGIVADPLARLKPEMDTTLLIAAEATRRGYEVFYAEDHTLTRSQDGPVAIFQRFDYRGADQQPVDAAGPAETMALDSFNVLTMRQDPPVNERYTAITFLLEGTKVPVVNDPRAVRGFNEKVCVLDVPQVAPASMVASSKDAILDFWRSTPDGIILKPLNAFNGIGIHLIRKDDSEETLFASVAEATSDGQEFTMCQQFIPAISEGDKRFFLVEGESIGRMNRVPAKGQYKANIHAGAQPAQFDPTPRDEEILEAVRGLMDHQALPMVCIDVIGEYLTEINVTSPSGIPEINRVYGDGHEGPLVDLLERRAV